MKVWGGARFDIIENVYGPLRVSGSVIINVCQFRNVRLPDIARGVGDS